MELTNLIQVLQTLSTITAPSQPSPSLLAAPKAPKPGRYVVVVDRGWIFAGDLSATEDGMFLLTSAVHVMSWSEIGFARMIAEWQGGKVKLVQVADVEIPQDSVIFRVPVGAEWGVK